MSMTKISIHALREEGDVVKHGVILPDWIFLSTPSARRATVPSFTPSGAQHIFLSTPSARRATRGTTTMNFG